MAIIFAVRGGSFTPRFSNSGSQHQIYNVDSAPAPSITVDATVLGGSKLDFNSEASGNSIAWPGWKNFSTKKAFSILMRYQVNFTGTPPQTRGMLLMDTFFQFKEFQFAIDSNGKFRPLIPKAGTGNNFNSPVGTFVNSFTSGDEVDIVIATDGLSGNDLEFWSDGVQRDTFAWPADNDLNKTEGYFPSIQFGTERSSQRGLGDLVEVVIWDEKIDPTNIPLVGGSGSLNGESRTAFVDAAAFGALSFTNLDVSDVRSGLAYTAAGIGKTGTLETIELVTDAIKADLAGGVLTGDLI